MSNFEYSLSHIRFEKLQSERELIKYLHEHDPDSTDFSINTANLNYALSKEMNDKQEEELQLLYRCGLFHDIGKLGMSQDFINYPNAYTIKMYNEMKKHTSGGAYILEQINAHQSIIETAKYHHCNFDGTGYPGGLYGVDIPFHARLTRVTDSIDAYMSKRCYKDGGPSLDVLIDLKQYIGSSYDPEIIELFEVVHRKVAKKCHVEGFDFPSQKVYMHFLHELYPNSFYSTI